VAYQLRSALPHARFILPTAPTRPISLNGGYPMPGWYDIHSLDSLQGRADGPGVAASTDYISGLMDSLAAGIPSDRVVMAGFSQGGAMALAMLGRVPGKVCGVSGAREGRVRAGWGRARARRAPFATLHPPSPAHLTLSPLIILSSVFISMLTQLAGVISMSGYLPLATASPSSPPAVPLHTPANGATPVLFCHGDADEVVRHEFGVLSADALKAAGVPVTFKTYRGMGHSACPAELGDVADFLTERLPPA